MVGHGVADVVQAVSSARTVRFRGRAGEGWFFYEVLGTSGRDASNARGSAFLWWSVCAQGWRRARLAGSELERPTGAAGRTQRRRADELAAS